jgi:hypothetical protein
VSLLTLNDNEQTKLNLACPILTVKTDHANANTLTIHYGGGQLVLWYEDDYVYDQEGMNGEVRQHAYDKIQADKQMIEKKIESMATYGF